MTKQNKKGKGRPKSAPTKRVIKGKGDYKVALNNLTTKMDGLLKKIPKGAFARAGNSAGNMFGGTMGAAVGKRMGRGLAAITGYGDYQVSANSLSTVSASVDMVPQFARTDHSVRVCHREFIGDLKVPLNPDEFKNNFVELINPANTTLFPWLSKMATLYTQYRIHGMVITYKTMSSNYSAGGGPLGTVIIATNYNVNDQSFTTKVQMENSEFAVSCNPSSSLIHAIECDPKFSGLQTLYVLDPATQQPGAVSDPRFYHYGKLQIATSGLPGAYNNTMGELWISYDIELMKPVIGKDEAPTPPIPPTPTVPGNVIVSLPTGGIGVLPTSEYTETTLTQLTSFPGGNPDALFDFCPDEYVPELVSGDALWRTSSNLLGPLLLTELEPGFNTLRIFRSGTYVVTASAIFSRSQNVGQGASTTSTTYTIAANNFTPVARNTGSGVTSTLTGYVTNWSAPKYGLINGPVTYTAGAVYLNSPTMYKIDDDVWTATVVVGGLNSGTIDATKFVELDLPYGKFSSVSEGGTAARVLAKTLNVKWLASQQANIVVV